MDRRYQIERTGAGASEHRDLPLDITSNALFVNHWVSSDDERGVHRDHSELSSPTHESRFTQLSHGPCASHDLAAAAPKTTAAVFLEPAQALHDRHANFTGLRDSRITAAESTQQHRLISGPMSLLPCAPRSDYRYPSPDSSQHASLSYYGQTESRCEVIHGGWINPSGIHGNSHVPNPTGAYPSSKPELPISHRPKLNQTLLQPVSIAQPLLDAIVGSVISELDTRGFLRHPSPLSARHPDQPLDTIPEIHCLNESIPSRTAELARPVETDFTNEGITLHHELDSRLQNSIRRKHKHDLKPVRLDNQECNILHVRSHESTGKLKVLQHIKTPSARATPESLEEDHGDHHDSADSDPIPMNRPRKRKYLSQGCDALSPPPGTNALSCESGTVALSMPSESDAKRSGDPRSSRRLRRMPRQRSESRSPKFGPYQSQRKHKPNAIIFEAPQEKFHLPIRSMRLPEWTTQVFDDKSLYEALGELLRQYPRLDTMQLRSDKALAEKQLRLQGFKAKLQGIKEYIVEEDLCDTPGAAGDMIQAVNTNWSFDRAVADFEDSVKKCVRHMRAAQSHDRLNRLMYNVYMDEITQEVSSLHREIKAKLDGSSQHRWALEAMETPQGRAQREKLQFANKFPMSRRS